MTLRILIVDDEPWARRRMATMLAQLTDVEIVGIAEDGDSALHLIETHAPNVVLLDIKMPGRNGLEMLPLLRAPNVPVIIFVTAFNEYAVRAFELAAVDYLLKPVPFDRMREALARARHALRSRDSESRLAEMGAVVAALRSDADIRMAERGYDRDFWVLQHGEYLRVPVERIEWIEAERDYVRLHTDNASYLVRDTMAKTEERLDPLQFVRIHRSTILRRTIVSAVRVGAYGALKVVLSNGIELPVGRSYAERARELFAGPARRENAA